MINSSSFIQANRYKKIMSLIARPNFFLIGLGRYTPWSIDISPPTVSGVEISVQELIGFIRVTEIRGLTPVTQMEDFKIEGVGYKKLSTFSEVQNTKCREVCFEGTLTHNQLPQSSWRSLSLFESANAVTATGFLIPPVNNLTLMYLIHQRPKTKEQNATETIRLILPIGEGL